jgi:hypothetical protein
MGIHLHPRFGAVRVNPAEPFCDAGTLIDVVTVRWIVLVKVQRKERRIDWAIGA